MEQRIGVREEVAGLPKFFHHGYQRVHSKALRRHQIKSLDVDLVLPLQTPQAYVRLR